MLKTILYNRDLSVTLVIFSCVLFLNACGDDSGGISERLSGPEAVSALPMRIDATVTPTVTPLEGEVTPIQQKHSEALEMLSVAEEEPEDQTEEEKPEPSELETRLSLLTPAPESLPEQAASAPSEKDSELSQETPEPTEEMRTLQTNTPPPLVSPTPEFTPTPETVQPKKAELQATPKQNPDVQKQAEHKNTPENQKSQALDSEETLKSPKKQTSPSKATKKEIKRTPTTQHASGQNVSDITLNDIVVCSALSNRTPSGIAQQFSLSKVKKVFTWMRVSGATPPMRLKHRYYREGKLVASISLKIKYPSMRTWSQKTFKGTESLGKWKVLVTNENHEVLAEKEFTLIP